VNEIEEKKEEGARIWTREPSKSRGIEQRKKREKKKLIKD
jgi:hypothetical protein